MKHKGCLTQTGGKTFHTLKGIGTDGGFSLCSSPKRPKSWDSGEVIWLRTFGIPIVTELMQLLSA